MRRFLKVRNILLAMYAATVCAPGFAGEGGLDELMRVYYFPPADPHTGALLDDASKLLSAARELPSEVSLWQSRADQRDEGKKETSLAWVSIDKQPVVPLQKLAYTYFKAKQYKEAAACYGRLYEESPERSHYKTMQVLCTRLAGNGGPEGRLNWPDSGSNAENEWQEWLKEVERLHEGFSHGGNND